MSRKTRIHLGLLAWLVVSRSLALGQDVPQFEIGLKPYGSYHGGDIDSVSLTNGNLTLHIPLYSYPQRGGKLSKSLVILYKNKGDYPVDTDEQLCYPFYVRRRIA